MEICGEEFWKMFETNLKKITGEKEFLRKKTFDQKVFLGIWIHVFMLAPWSQNSMVYCKKYEIKNYIEI